MRSERDSRPPTHAVVVGLNTNGLANVRALARNGVPVDIFLSETESREIYAATRYGRKRIVPVTDGAAILEQLHALPSSVRYLLFPTTDYQVRFLSQNRADLPPYCELPFPEDSVVRILMEKDLFDGFCRRHRYPVPQTATVRDTDGISRICSDMTFPIIAKTATKIYKDGLDKAYILSGSEELRSWYDAIKGIQSEFVIQEFIPGGDRSVCFAMQYISEKGELLASFTGRKIRQWPPLKGGTSSAEPVYDTSLSEMTYDFFRKAGFWGIGSMEYKQDPRNGQYYMIEPTVCRTDFQEGVAIVNRVNIPMVAYRSATGQAVPPTVQGPGDARAWMHVLYDRLSKDWYVSRKELTHWEWLASLRRVRSFDAFSLSDPGPLVRSFLEKINHRFAKWTGRNP
jgi:D-aspartate ligase